MRSAPRTSRRLRVGLRLALLAFALQLVAPTLHAIALGGAAPASSHRDAGFARGCAPAAPHESHGCAICASVAQRASGITTPGAPTHILLLASAPLSSLDEGSAPTAPPFSPAAPRAPPTDSSRPLS